MSAPEEVDCGGPDYCVDDLCRGMDEGICGRPSAHVLGLGCGRDDCMECLVAQEADDGWSEAPR